MVDNKEIKVKLSGSKTVRWQELKDIQGSVKTIDEQAMLKMIESLKINGFCDPFIFWNDPIKKDKICIAGNQRLKALYRLRDLGFSIPDKLPGIPVEAENEKDAKKILLSLASTFGTVNKTELKDFIQVSGLDHIEVDAVTNFIEIKDSKPEHVIESPPPEIKPNIEYLKLGYVKDDYLTILAKLDTILQHLDNAKDHSECVNHIIDYYLEKEKI